jgi:phosphatidate phosphatase APP1
MDVVVELSGSQRTARSNKGGLIDAVLDVRVPAGRASARLSVGGRYGTATVHVTPDDARIGLVCDVDDTVWVTDLHNPLRAVWRTMARSSGERRPVPGMASLLRGLRDHYPDAPVVYVSNGPWNLNGPVTRFLERRGFPAGSLLMTDWGITPRAWFRDGKAHKRSSLERLVEDFPQVRWVLIGDDGEHDPELYGEFAARNPDRVAAIALRELESRQFGRPDVEYSAREPVQGRSGVAPAASSRTVVLRSADGMELLRGLRAALGVGPVGERTGKVED